MEIRKPLSVLVEHLNILFVFSSIVCAPVLGRQVVSKVQRWALYISRLDLNLECPRSRKVFAEILTRRKMNTGNINCTMYLSTPYR